MFNMIIGINKSKAFSKHISCKCKGRFDGKKFNSDQWWNNDKCQCECKQRYLYEKLYIWNPATCSYENGEYEANVMEDSGITCDKIVIWRGNKNYFNKLNEKAGVC